jgi:tetratricopeptide (TPR) repeat protein
MIRELNRRAGLYKLLPYVCAAAAFVCGSNVAQAAESAWQSLENQGEQAFNQQHFIRAEDYYRQAVKAVESSSHTTEELVQCLNRLANVLTLENKTEEAKSTYQHSLRIVQKAYGPESPKIVPALFSLGSIYESEGDPSTAMQLYQRAVKINEKHYGPFSPAVAQSLHHLGRASFNAGQTENAEGHYKRSLAILEKDPGLESSQQMEDLLRDYGDLLRKKDTIGKDLISDFQKEILKDNVGSTTSAAPAATPPASAWQRQLTAHLHATRQSETNEEPQVSLRGEIGPLSNDKLAPIYDTMSSVFYKQSRYQQGEPLYKRMIAIDVKSLGEDHPAVADDLSGLALLYMAQGRYQEAEPLLKRALSIYETTYGNDNMLVIKTRESLASVYTHLGKPDQSAEAYTHALADAKVTLGPNNLETARMLNELAFLYYRQGKLEDACTLYQWALASTEGSVGPHNQLVAACLKDYAQVLRSLGRNDEAAKMEERAEVITASNNEPTPALSKFEDSLAQPGSLLK